MPGGTISDREIGKFDRLAAQWWDPNGPMRPLHRMNPARLRWIEALVTGTTPTSTTRVLDVGCGAGLFAEALARHGHDVLGIDAAPEAIAAARAHAAGRDLALQYRVATAEDLVEQGRRFPLVTALEVIEHVPDQAGFVRVLGRLVEPGGLLVMSTLNRSRRAWLTAKLGAEYVLRMLPVGTHDWNAFVTPAELAAMMRDAGLRVSRTTGMNFDPLTGRWQTTPPMHVNYLIAGVR